MWDFTLYGKYMHRYNELIAAMFNVKEYDVDDARNIVVVSVGCRCFHGVPYKHWRKQHVEALLL